MPPDCISIQTHPRYVESLQKAIAVNEATGQKFAIVTLPSDTILRDENDKEWSIPDGSHLVLKPGDRIGNARMGRQTAMLGLKIAAGIVGTAAVSLVIGMLAVGMSDRNRMMGYGYGGGYGGYGMMPWI